MSDCTFCDIAARRKSARVVREWPDVIAFRDKKELVPDGHILVIPRRHVANAAEDPRLTGRVMQCAAELAAEFESFNIITSGGKPATQSEFHLHAHLILRRHQDGLMVPWGTTGNPHAPHACKRSLEAEDNLTKLVAIVTPLIIMNDALSIGSG